MVSILFSISSFPRLFYYFWRAVPVVPTTYKWYHHHFHVTRFCQISGRIHQLAFTSGSSGTAKWIDVNSFLFLLINTRSGSLDSIEWSVGISKFQRISSVSFLGRVLVYVNTFYWYGQILISCTFPSASPFLPSHVSSCIPFLQVCSIRLLCDQPSHLSHLHSWFCVLSIFAVI